MGPSSIGQDVQTLQRRHKRRRSKRGGGELGEVRKEQGEHQMPRKKRHLETLGHWDCPWAAVRTPVIRKDLYNQDLCPRHLTNSGKRGAGANLISHTSPCPTATKTQHSPQDALTTAPSTTSPDKSWSQSGVIHDFLSETGLCHVGQAGLKLVVLLPQPPEC